MSPIAAVLSAIGGVVTESPFLALARHERERRIPGRYHRRKPIGPCVRMSGQF